MRVLLRVAISPPWRADSGFGPCRRTTMDTARVLTPPCAHHSGNLATLATNPHEQSGLGLDQARLRAAWDRAARWYDAALAPVEWTLLKRRRRRLLQRARGRVLDVAAGTGRNLALLPAGCRVVAIDLSLGMLLAARRRTAGAALVVADGECLPFRRASFDTVVSSLVLCTFPDPETAFAELSRMCAPGAVLLFLEHGRSSWTLLARLQDRWAGAHERGLGCRWNREPLDILRRAGLEVRRARRVALGMLHLVEASLPH